MDWERAIGVVSSIFGIVGFIYGAAQKSAVKTLAIEHKEEFERYESIRKELCKKCGQSHQETIKALKLPTNKHKPKSQEPINA